MAKRVSDEVESVEESSMEGIMNGNESNEDLKQKAVEAYLKTAEYRRKYNERPDVKARAAERRKNAPPLSEEQKAKRREYGRTPEAVERRKKYQAKRQELLALGKKLLEEREGAPV